MYETILQMSTADYKQASGRMESLKDTENRLPSSLYQKFKLPVLKACNFVSFAVNLRPTF